MKSGLGQWLLVVGLSVFLAGSYLTWRNLRAGPLPAGEVPSAIKVPDSTPLPAFTLHGLRGELTNANLAGHWSFLFFGYTQCPDICPAALTLMKEVRTILAATSAVSPAPTFQVFFVSVDPRRDTLQLLGEYVAAFDPSFIGASGDDAILAPLTHALGAYYQRHDSGDTRHYTVDHSTAIYLIDPQGHLAGVFSPPQTAARVAADYQRMVHHQRIGAAVTPLATW